MITHKAERLAIYCRVSLDVEGEGLAVARQEELARAEAKRRGWTVADVLVDNSISASSFSKKKRPAYRAMIDGIKAGTYDGIMAYALDRLTRNGRELQELIELGESLRVPIATIQGDFDLTTAQGVVVARQMGAMAEFETRMKSERQKAANRQRLQLGRHYGRAIPLGYKRDSSSRALVIDRDAEPYLRRAFEMALAGASSRDILRYWDDEGFSTQSGKPWTTGTVYRVLKNPVYAGIVVYKGEEIAAEAQWEPYFDKTTHGLLKSALTARNNGTPPGRAASHAYLLSNILFCSCGQQMTGVRQTGWRPDVPNRRSYACKGRHRGECSRQALAEPIEARVLSYVVGVLNSLTPERVLRTEVVTRQKEIAADLDSNERKRAEIKADRSLDLDSKLDVYRMLDARRRELRDELADLTKDSLLGGIVAHVLNWTDGQSVDMGQARVSWERVQASFEALTYSQQRVVVEALGIYTLRARGKGSMGAKRVQIYARDPLSGEISEYPTDEDAGALD